MNNNQPNDPIKNNNFFNKNPLLVFAIFSIVTVLLFKSLFDEGGGLDGVYGPYAQDARRDLYEAALQRLQEQHLVYPCYCTRAELAASAPHGEDGERIYQGTCASGVAENKRGRKPSLRLKVPAVEMAVLIENYMMHQPVSK